jgi:bifunctional UDP-N-acetylglucosamine pyrophosphorylase/glucosamine-1-phosphate N-acetyltransferase
MIMLSKEYYLTDIVKMSLDGITIAAIEPDHAFTVEGVNNRQQLTKLRASWQHKLVRDLQVAGVQFTRSKSRDIRVA